MFLETMFWLLDLPAYYPITATLMFCTFIAGCFAYALWPVSE